MALPVILVDSATGSDTAASGAGPATALTGTSASTDAAGTLVTLDGSPDLSGVATDGSHVIYLADTTAGNRNFGKITAADNSAKTVTVSNAFGLSLSGKSWAIGGKRASVYSATSKKLFDNNSAAGDAMAGWTVRMASGHSETAITTEFTFRRAGDLTTDGFITLEGEAGAATLPLITFNRNDTCVTPRANYIRLRWFELQNTNATKTSSTAIIPTNICVIDGVKISHSTNKFYRGIGGYSPNIIKIENCEVGYCAGPGLEPMGNGGFRIRNNYVHDCTGTGLVCGSYDNYGLGVVGNIFARNNIGMTWTQSGSGSDRSWEISGNVFDANTSHGLQIATSVTNLAAIINAQMYNNIFSNNGGYGLNFSASSVTKTNLDNVSNAGNCAYNNTSGASNPSGILVSDPNVNPSYANASSGDFSIGTNLKAKGYPLGGTLTVGRTSTTNSYVDPGAAQRQESSSSYSRGRVVNA